VSLTLSRIEEIGAYDQDLSAIIWGGCGHYARQGGASPILLGTRGSLHLSVSACAALNRSAIGRCPCASSKCSWPEFALPHQRQPPKRVSQFSRALRESSFWKALGQRARLHKSEPGLPCSRPMRTQASVLLDVSGAGIFKCAAQSGCENRPSSFSCGSQERGVEGLRRWPWLGGLTDYAPTNQGEKLRAPFLPAKSWSPPFRGKVRCMKSASTLQIWGRPA
jgi:hypothetical protein